MTDQKPLVSIVIPVFNRVKLTRQCLEALYKNTSSQHPFEVIVVDNASTDYTKKLLLQTAGENKDFYVLSNTENLGFARACNIGAGRSSGKYVVFLNNDTEVLPNWLSPLVKLLDEDSGVGAAGSKLLFPDGTIQHAGVEIADEGKLGDPLRARHVFYGERGDLEEANQLCTYKALTAACLLVRKSAFDSVNGFDEAFWNGYEDVDLCFKLIQKGWQLFYQPRSVVIHYESQSGPERFAAVRQNIQRLHSKWLGTIEPDVIVDDEEIADDDNISRTQWPSAEPLTSIIILTHNEIECTRHCLESLKVYTPEKHELICVDNASNDGTVAYLQDMAVAHENLRLVLNNSNLGFSAANNQGIALARGDYVLLLNNDTIVTKGWLKRMLSVFDQYPEVGIVGPVSNSVSGPQLLKDTPYKDEKDMQAFAAKWANDHAGETIEINRVVGFCLLARKAVIDRIGGLDEQFATGNFEDDDFSYRASMAGFKARIAKDVFIHHVGGQTFNGAGIDWRQNMERNWRLFKEKWDLPKDLPLGQGYAIPFQPPDRARYFIPVTVESTLADHKPDSKGRLWQEAKTPSAPPPLAVCLIREDADMEALQSSFNRFMGHLPMAVDWQATCVAEMARRADEGPFLLLLSPDVVLSKGCLDLLLAIAGSDPSIAAVGPMSNSAPAPQKVKQGYKSLRKELQKFAKRRFRRHKGLWDAVSYLGGFCLLLNTENLRKSGGFNIKLPLPEALWELYGRLRANNFKLLCALGAYVHHDKLTEDEGALYDERAAHEGIALEGPLQGRALLQQNDQAPASAKSSSVDQSTIIPGRLPKDPRISVCLIVRDEEKMLKRCLTSVQGIADEIVVLDTGSEDNTVSVAKELGARVSHFVWCDDFSAARNEALRSCSGDWILQIDADEEILPESIPPLKKALSKPSVLAYTVTVDNGPSYSARFYKSGRLFRNHPRIRYSRPYHETIQTSAETIMSSEGGWKLVHEPKIVIRHYGYEDICMRERGKLDREIKSLKGYLKDHPEDQAMAIRLAEVYNQVGNHVEAMAMCNNILAFDPHCAAAHHIKGVAYSKKGNRENAIVEFKKALSADPKLAWVHYHLGCLYNDQARFDEAITHLRKAVSLDPDFGKAHTGLGMAYHMKGRLDEAFEAYRHAIRVDPTDGEAFFNLGILHRSKGMLDEAIKAYEKALFADPKLAQAHNNLAVVYHMKGDHAQALKHCEKAMNLGFQVHPQFLQDLKRCRK